MLHAHPRTPSEYSLNEFEQLEVIRNTPGRWNTNETTNTLESTVMQKAKLTKSLHTNSSSTRSMGRTNQSSTGKLAIATITTIPSAASFRVRPQRADSKSHGALMLPVVPTTPSAAKVDESSAASRVPKVPGNSTSVVNAYKNLITQTDALEQSYVENAQRRQINESVLRMGMAQLSDDRVKKQKELIRFNALKNEVDIFQQHLDPFVFEMRTPHEHQVNSSVYRHFIRMQSIQDMGIPIYSLGNYLQEPQDKIIMPRTFQSFYRRIRRRNAADFIDADLIPRPNAKQKDKPTQE